MPTPTTRKPVVVEIPEQGIAIRESRHAEGFQMDMAKWAFALIVFVCHGSGDLVSGRRRLPLRRDGLVLVPPGTRYRLEDAPGDPLWLYLIAYDAAMLARFGLRPERLLQGRPAAEQQVAWRNRCREMLYLRDSRNPLAALRMQHLGLALLDDLWRAGQTQAAPATPRPAAARVRQYVRELASQFHAETDLDDVAQRLGLSRRRFTQLFREQTGRSWLQQVRALRLAQARRLLSRTDRPVNAVLFDCGFNDPAAFYRAFRAASGCTPQQWRERRR